jgi:type 1 glutamine amidotransferase
MGPNPLPSAQELDRRPTAAPILRSPIRWSMLVAALLVVAGCGNDDGAKPAGVGGTAGAGGTRPMEIMDAAMPDRSSAEDTGPGPSNGDSTPGQPDVTTSSDVIATADVRAPDADATTSPADGSTTDTGGPLPKINVLAIGELMTDMGPEIHAPFVMAAKTWLTGESNLTVTHIESPNTITDALLANYALILQLNFTPYRWNATAKAAFEKYITEGKGGWVGMHHSGLYGLGNDPWPWFFTFFGQITYQNYIPTFAAANVRVEEAAHPLFKRVPASFLVTTEEWYTWDKSPRPNTHVLANVDENSYMPNSTIKMGGDHPVIWTNDTVKAKNVYIFMGHHPNLFENASYVTLLRNAINWAGTPK